MRRLLLSSLVVTAATIIGYAPPALAQTRPALVRNVDEPARVPYFVSERPTCGFVNECIVTGPTIPAGKRLHLVSISGSLINPAATSAFVSVELNNSNQPLLFVSALRENVAFFGTAVSFNTAVDLYFEAGQTPLLVMGASTNLSNDLRNRFTLSGYIVDVLP